MTELYLPEQNGGIRVKFVATELIDPARARLERQKQYARPLSQSGRRADGLRKWLDQAAKCIAALAAPEIVLMPVTARPVAGGVTIADRVTLQSDDLERDIRQGGVVTAYLLTLGYEQAHAFEWLKQDYASHHVQSDLGSEMLFALGREAYRLQRTGVAGARLRRVSIQTQEQCGSRQVWDPVQVQALLGVFDCANPGVRVSATGCFQPLNSLLGLTIRI